VQGAIGPSADALWYAAYGSNMAAARFACYLVGGCPPGASRTYVGARDRNPPADVRPLVMRGGIYFAWESPTWGGGIAFYDAHAAGTALARAYLVTPGQLSDVVAQEMHRDPGADLDLGELLAAGSSVHGPGRYESLHVVGEIDHRPVVTFTSSWAVEEVELNPPVAPYLSMVAAGIHEAHSWGSVDIADYLLACPGVSQGWSRDELVAVLPTY
jgi:hypothetical protein